MNCIAFWSYRFLWLQAKAFIASYSQHPAGTVGSTLCTDLRSGQSFGAVDQTWVSLLLDDLSYQSQAQQLLADADPLQPDTRGGYTTDGGGRHRHEVCWRPHD